MKIIWIEDENQERYEVGGMTEGKTIEAVGISGNFGEDAEVVFDDKSTLVVKGFKKLYAEPTEEELKAMEESEDEQGE